MSYPPYLHGLGGLDLHRLVLEGSVDDVLLPLHRLHHHLLEQSALQLLLAAVQRAVDPRTLTALLLRSAH